MDQPRKGMNWTLPRRDLFKAAAAGAGAIVAGSLLKSQPAQAAVKAMALT